MKPEQISCWQTASFEQLSSREIYEILRLRQQVFAVEQNSIYLDPDGLDLEATHISYWHAGQLLAYLRCLPPGLQQTESALGRVLVAAPARGQNLGRELVQRGIVNNLTHWPKANILIHAQAHLEAYYRNFGFVTQGSVYQLDGIPHIEMLLTAAEEK